MDGLMTNPSCIETYTGLDVDLLHPEPEMFCIEDIARGLAGEGRYNNHCRVWLSVAQHSCIVADQFADQRERAFALLHDAHEAYVKDIPRPLKRLLSGYAKIAGDVQAALEESLLPDEWLAWYDLGNFPARLKSADNAVCRAEAALLMASGGAEWGWNGTPIIQIDLEPMGVHQAEALFLDYWRSLWTG